MANPLKLHSSTDGKGNITYVKRPGGSDKQLLNTEGGLVRFGNDFKNFDIKDGGKNNRNRINSVVNRYGEVIDAWINPGRTNQLTGGANPLSNMPMEDDSWKRPIPDMEDCVGCHTRKNLRIPAPNQRGAASEYKTVVAAHSRENTYR